MRDALTGKLITRIPLDDRILQALRPALCGDPSRRHPRHLPQGLPGQQPDHAGDQPPRRRLTRTTATTSPSRSKTARTVQGRALIGCDGMWSKMRERVVGDGKPRVSGHIAYRAVLKREEVPEDLWRPDVVLWAGPRTHFVHYPLRRGELYNLVAVFHSDHYEEGWDAEGSKDLLWQHFKGQVPQVLRMLERIETWRMWVLVRPRAGEELDAGPRHAARRCRASDAAISGAGRLHGDRGRGGAGRQGRGAARRPAGGVPGLSAGALSAHRPRADHGAGLWRVLSRARRRRRTARHGARPAARRSRAYEGIAWLYGGP